MKVLKRLIIVFILTVFAGLFTGCGMSTKMTNIYGHWETTEPLVLDGNDIYIYLDLSSDKTFTWSYVNDNHAYYIEKGNWSLLNTIRKKVLKLQNTELIYEKNPAQANSNLNKYTYQLSADSLILKKTGNNQVYHFSRVE